MSQTDKTPVAVLGATGMVGQRLLGLLADHPWFEPVELVASTRSAGRRYGEAAHWRQQTPIPLSVADQIVLGPDTSALRSPLVFSALGAAAAGELEPRFARLGHAVVSNARTHRMDPDVPLVIPEINADHLQLLQAQRAARGWDGCIVTNPNCSTIGLTLALAPLHRAAGVEAVVVTTMQAVSGAGYPGVASMDMIDNIVPGISGEEDKIAREPNKILGLCRDGRVEDALIEVSPHTHRVPVIDGHLMAVSVRTSESLGPEDAQRLFENFRGSDLVQGLPSAPATPIVVVPGEQRPQTRLDRDCSGGMAVTVGRIARCPVLGLRFSLLSHNTLRGAAGGTVLVAEALRAQDRL